MGNLRFRTVCWLVGLCLIGLIACGSGVDDLEIPDDAVARIVYFAADDCEICDELSEELVAPLQARCGTALELKNVDIGLPEGYEAFVTTEKLVVGEVGRWEIPTIVMGDTAFVGEEAIRTGLFDHLKCVFGSGGNAWPTGDALLAIEPQAAPANATGATPFSSTGSDSVASCVDEEEAVVCASPAPIFMLYLSGTDCADTCERTRYDLIYLKGVFPQVSFEERSIEDNLALADALGEELGIPEGQRRTAPAVIVGEDYLVGDDLALDGLRERVAAYTESGATASWYLIDLP